MVSLPPPTPVSSVLDAIRRGGIGLLPRDEHEPILVDLVRSWQPAGRVSRAEQDTTARRLVAFVLDRLEAFPGQVVQDRWDLSCAGTTSKLEWTAAAGLSCTQARPYFHAVNALLVTRAVRPASSWMTNSKWHALWARYIAYHDTELFEQVAAAARASKWDRAAWRTTSQLAQLCIITGKDLSSLTGADLVDFRDAELARGRGDHHMHTTWKCARQAGLLRGEPDSMLPAVREQRLSIAQMVDRYAISDLGIRDVFVAYLTERSIGADYPTVEKLSRLLCKQFWADVQDHHPGLTTLALSESQAGAWRTRAASHRDGRARSDLHQVLAGVRSFYSDISQWAVEDPARWAQWVARNPVPARLAAETGKRATLSREARMHARTRTLAPLLPVLVASVRDELRRAERLLAAGQETAMGGTFVVDGETWTRPEGTHSYRPLACTAVDELGRRVNLTTLEDIAFWTWASVEVLRHSGVRIEEMLELTHLSIRPFRKPTGEIVPLLQIAPSKTDTERIMPASPALAHVLSRLVDRVSDHGNRVPLVIRRDDTKRVFSPPMPYLFQRRWVASDWPRVITGAALRGWLKQASRRAGLTDNDGRPLEVSPHDFRRIFLTDLVGSGFPIHIAAQLAGHRDINTTRGYTAIYPTEVFEHYEKFLARRRAERPTDEYRQPTREELDAFADHFGRRRVELGDCVRPYGSGCTHEHACLRCEFLQVHPDAHARLDTIETDLHDRITTASTQTWLGDVEQLRITLSRLHDKRAQLPPMATPHPAAGTSEDLLAAHPIATVPPAHGRAVERTP